jgi:phenylacetate-CoA ligase
MLSSYHLTVERLPEYLDALEKFKPDLLHAYPSATLQLAEYLEGSGQSWRLPLRGLLCGSERLTIPQKRLLERVFKCRVYRWYGHAERVVLAGEGRESELFYFWPQYGRTEQCLEPRVSLAGSRGNCGTRTRVSRQRDRQAHFAHRLQHARLGL